MSLAIVWIIRDASLCIAMVLEYVVQKDLAPKQGTARLLVRH
jgi:hypothetical protein